MKDKAAFEKLFEEAYKDNLYKVRYYAYNYLKDYDMADNVAQETFYRLWENREKVNFDEGVLPYLILIARNMCLNMLRRERIHDRFVGHEKNRSSCFDVIALFDESSVSVYSSEMKNIFRKCMDKLPDDVRETFMLSRNTDMTNNDIAEISGVSVKTIEGRMTKALKILRKGFRDYIGFVIGYLLFRLYL